MSPRARRILARATGVGLITGVIGYGLLWAYLRVAASLLRDVEIQTEGRLWQGPLLFALLGFAVTAALETVRRPPAPPERG